MLREVGFDGVETLYYSGRVYGYAEKKSQKGICRAGLSVSNIR
jgi:hypothetical protein